MIVYGLMLLFWAKNFMEYSKIIVINHFIIVFRIPRGLFIEL